MDDRPPALELVEPRPDADARLNRLLNLILEAAVDALEFDAATISARIDRALSTVGSSDPRLVALDDAQYASRRGPCLDVLDGGRPLVVADASTNPEWDHFREQAELLGIHTTLSIHLPIPAEDPLAGSLNFYSRREFQVGDQQVRMAETFAEQIAVTMQSVESYRAAGRLAEQMAEAMRSRAVIEQAKGIVMAARRTHADDAFQYLVARSMNENRKLRDIAAELVQRAGEPA